MPVIVPVFEPEARRSAGCLVGRVKDHPREHGDDAHEEIAPDIVIHAAALKHVPYLEADWGEGIKTNIFGSVVAIEAAIAAGAGIFVMISTDKAIEPVSMLGATKRFAEMYAQARDAEFANGNRGMRLVAVRFGNVLGSVGSVVPKFKAQIERGGPVTVTSPEMIRSCLEIMGTTAERTLMVGDRLDTDILAGINAGTQTLLVLTGVSTVPDIEAFGIVPDVVAPTLAPVTEALLARELKASGR